MDLYGRVCNMKTILSINVVITGDMCVIMRKSSECWGESSVLMLSGNVHMNQ